MDCTEDTVKFVKTERAALNKEFAAIEELRKQVKNAVMQPYNDFDAVYKQHISDKYKAADAQLKNQIDTVESGVKQLKFDEIKEYFEEYRLSCGSCYGFVDIDRAGLNVTLSASVKSLKEQAKAFIDRICGDLEMIETLERKDEILVEYQQHLDAPRAIKAVADRYKAIEEQKARQIEAEARRAAEEEAMKRVDAALQKPLMPPISQPLEPQPPASDDPIKTLALKVTAPLSKLKELKLFLDNGGYQYE
jgi:hypothetical protein